MLKADANVGRYLPNNSNFLDRTIACRVDVLEDGIDHLLLADGPIGSADACRIDMTVEYMTVLLKDGIDQIDPLRRMVMERPSLWVVVGGMVSRW